MSRLSALLLTACLAGCGTLPAPQAPSARSEADDTRAAAGERTRAIEKRQALARQREEAGDFAGAALQWQALTLIAPQEVEFRRALERSRAAAGERATQRLQDGRRALDRGDLERATDALLDVLALMPGNEEAASLLRKAERRSMARIQANHAARMRNLGSETMADVPARPR